jgi:hypothetical protein
MATKFYSKDLPDQPIYIQGRPYKFDFIATDDPWLIGEFENAIRAQTGGISEVSKEAYDEALKKKSSSAPSLPNFQRSAEIRPHQFQSQPVARAAVVVGNPAGPPPNLGPAEPIVVTPPKVFMPKVAKVPSP